MPLYVADLSLDAAHLSTQQFGALVKLKMSYWRRQGPLDDDDSQLANICCDQKADWPAIRPALLSPNLFRIEGGKWIDPGLDAEIIKAQKKAAGKMRAYLASPLAKSQRDAQCGPQSDTHCGTQSQSQSHITKGESQWTRAQVEEMFLRKGSNSTEARRFFNYYKARGWMMGATPMHSLEAAADSWLLKRDTFRAKSDRNTGTCNDPNDYA